MSDEYNASDPAQVKAARLASKAADRQRASIVAWVLSTPAGRQWVYTILAECHVFSNPFRLDPYGTAFACGEQNVGQRLLGEVSVHSELYILMLREAKERDERSTTNPDSSFDPAAGDAG